jgi:hypothetical protein
VKDGGRGGVESDRGFVMMRDVEFIQVLASPIFGRGMSTSHNEIRISTPLSIKFVANLYRKE